MFEPQWINESLTTLQTCYNEKIILKLKNFKKVEVLESIESIQTENPYVYWFVYKCYFKGHGISVNWDKAFTFLQKALVITVNPIFLYDSAVMHEFGMGTSINWDKAHTLYFEALNLNIDNTSLYTGAIYYKLGYLFHKGIGVSADLEKAIEYYNIGIQYKNYKSAYYCGLIYYNKYEFKISFTYFETCFIFSKGIFSEVLYILGKCYEFGFGCKINYEKASELYAKGSRMNHLECIRNYADLYLSKKCKFKFIES